MTKILAAITGSAWVRTATLFVLIAVPVLWFGTTPRERSYGAMVLAHYLGLVLPALLLGAAWGWIWFSRRQWMWATAVLLVGTFAVVYKGGPLNEAYKKADAEAVRQAPGVVPQSADLYQPYPGTK
jgi:hypothetical protein